MFRFVLTLVLLVCSFSVAAYDSNLPRSQFTPGKANPAVTQANIHQTICVPGWTATVRPPASFTNALKRNQLLTVYTNGGSLDDFEEDHLIPLSSGGDPRDVRNLWPQPRISDFSAYDKDACEKRSQLAICAGKLSLDKARTGFATDWIKFCSHPW